MTELFELDQYFNNPYREPVRIILSLMTMECDRTEMLQFLSSTTALTADLKYFLRLRNSRVLLLLAYWYILRRTIIEYQTICMYLRKRHSGNTILNNYCPSHRSNMAFYRNHKFTTRFCTINLGRNRSTV